MAMRIDLAFAKPLNRDGRARVLLACAGLAKARRVSFARDDRGAAVVGEALGTRPLLAALAEHGLTPEGIRTTLDEAEDARADDLPQEGGERVRAIGR